MKVIKRVIGKRPKPKKIECNNRVVYPTEPYQKVDEDDKKAPFFYACGEQNDSYKLKPMHYSVNEIVMHYDYRRMILQIVEKREDKVVCATMGANIHKYILDWNQIWKVPSNVILSKGDFVNIIHEPNPILYKVIGLVYRKPTGEFMVELREHKTGKRVSFFNAKVLVKVYQDE